MSKIKVRLDQYLTDNGLAQSRSQAKSIILAGNVRVNGQVVTKAGQIVPDDAQVSVKEKPRFVSRAGDKLQGALDDFALDVTGLSVLDAGLSTGGFTDCLLQAGVTRVVGVDVGYGDVALKLREDPRLELIERQNLRYLLDKPKWSQQLAGSFDLVTLDLSFISLVKVVEVVCQLLRGEGHLLAMIKPQFELQRHEVGKGGIVRDIAMQQEAVSRVTQAYSSQGFEVLGVHPSHVQGSKGNQEYFLLAQKSVRFDTPGAI